LANTLARVLALHLLVVIYVSVNQKNPVGEVLVARISCCRVDLLLVVFLNFLLGGGILVKIVSEL